MKNEEEIKVEGEESVCACVIYSNIFLHYTLDEFDKC